MSNQINDGGPAFPLGPTDSTMKPHADGGGHMIVTHYGMERGISIRDYFAAAALQGLMAVHTSGGCLVDDLYAKYAYDLADAMLKQRDLK
jgi:hypothetical protein